MVSSDVDAYSVQRCLGGTNRDCEDNWVILMHGPQGLCDLKGFFCLGKPARGRLQNHEISHCFLLRWCCQFLTFQGGYFEENIVVFSPHNCCPAMVMEWWKNASLLQVSCYLLLQCLFWYAYSFGYLFFLYVLFMGFFLLIWIGKCFNNSTLGFLLSSKLFLPPPSDISLLYIITVKPEFLK